MFCLIPRMWIRPGYYYCVSTNTSAITYSIHGVSEPEKHNGITFPREPFELRLLQAGGKRKRRTKLIFKNQEWWLFMPHRQTRNSHLLDLLDMQDVKLY